MAGDYVRRRKGGVTEGAHGDWSRAAGLVLREFRTIKGLSQEKLGNALEVSFQQVQKYEKGTNRISIPILMAACEVLSVSPSEFLERVRETFEAGRLERTGIPTRRASPRIRTMKTAQQIDALPDHHRGALHRLVDTLYGDVKASSPDDET
jgi:transcriptional regulator with XRE-family HTH domain